MLPRRHTHPQADLSWSGPQKSARSGFVYHLWVALKWLALPQQQGRTQTSGAMTTNDAPEPARTLADARRRWMNEPPITLTLPRGDAWLLLTAVQLRRRDFAIADDLVNDLRRVGRTVQNAVCAPDDHDLRWIAETGWDTTTDTVLASGEHNQHAMRYAFVIEDSHNGETWCQVSDTINDCDTGAGVEEVHDLGPADYARRVLARWFAHRCRTDSYDWQGEVWHRCSVWDIAHSMDNHWGTAHPDEPPADRVGHWLKANGCAPHAVEVRTPTQAVRDIEDSPIRTSIHSK